MKTTKRKRKKGLRPLTIAKRARKALEEKKGREIVILDVRKISNVTDYFVIASGSNQPHLKAMFNEVLHSLKKDGIMCYRRAGDPESGWMVLDYIDVVMHILLDTAREYYAIEDLWEEAPRV